MAAGGWCGSRIPTAAIGPSRLEAPSVPDCSGWRHFVGHVARRWPVQMTQTRRRTSMHVMMGPPPRHQGIIDSVTRDSRKRTFSASSAWEQHESLAEVTADIITTTTQWYHVLVPGHVTQEREHIRPRRYGPQDESLAQVTAPSLPPPPPPSSTSMPGRVVLCTRTRTYGFRRA
jgi:hypothetical protein